MNGHPMGCICVECEIETVNRWQKEHKSILPPTENILSKEVERLRRENQLLDAANIVLSTELKLTKEKLERTQTDLTTSIEVGDALEEEVKQLRTRIQDMDDELKASYAGELEKEVKLSQIEALYEAVEILYLYRLSWRHRTENLRRLWRVFEQIRSKKNGD